MTASFEVRFERRRGATGAAAPAGGELRPGGLDEAEALRLLRRTAARDAGDPDYNFILGEALLRARRHCEAVAALSLAAAARPEDVEYQLTLGEALWACGQYEEAARTFAAAADVRPEDPDTWNGLGAALVQTGELEAAIAALGEAQSRDATRPETHSNLGVARWRQGEREPALALLRAAVRMSGAPGWIHRNLAHALTVAGQLAPAVRSLREAVRLAPDDAEGYADLGDALLESGQVREAEEAYQRAIGLKPTILDDRPASQAGYRSLVTRSIRSELGLRRSPLRRHLVTVASAPLGALALALSLLRRPVALALLGAPTLLALFALARLGPHVVTYFLFQDDLAAAALAPLEEDFDVRDRIAHAIERRGLNAHLSSGDCDIETRPPWRTITCRYDVPVMPLPGWRTRLRFRPSVERPFLTIPKPIIL